MSLSQQLLDIYERLLAAYGPQSWWPGAADPFEVIVGAILTQSAAWTNVEKALANLRAENALSLQALLTLSEEEVAGLVRPSGYFNMKARKLRAFAAMVEAEFAGDLAKLLVLPMTELRTRLLATYGIGPETADDIVLYAANQPSFVIDAYTVRLFTRLGIEPGQAAVNRCEAVGNRQSAVGRRSSYDSWRGMFMENLPPSDVALFNEYHALIVRHGVMRCRKRAPLCDGCPLLDRCPTGQGAVIV